MLFWPTTYRCLLEEKRLYPSLLVLDKDLCGFLDGECKLEGAGLLSGHGLLTAGWSGWGHRYRRTLTGCTSRSFECNCSGFLKNADKWLKICVCHCIDKFSSFFSFSEGKTDRRRFTQSWLKVCQPMTTILHFLCFHQSHSLVNIHYSYSIALHLIIVILLC